MRHAPFLLGPLLLALAAAGCGDEATGPGRERRSSEEEAPGSEPEGGSKSTMHVHYLEIVTPDVDGVCATYARLHGATFGDPVPELGNARTAPLPDGGTVGVRAPMSETEEPVVRPYLRVDDLEAAVAAAAEAGAQIALPAMEIPGRGTIAIFIHGGVQHGLWKP